MKKKSNDMPARTFRTRRNLFKGTASGLALVIWHKPMINAVMLLAHTQTSMVMCPMVNVQSCLGQQHATCV